MAAFRLTEKRRRFVRILEQSDAPLSAYELMDKYKAVHSSRILAPSVYRILDSLIAAGYVHRLETCNKYIACAHEPDHCDNEIPQFFICDNCHTVTEWCLPAALLSKLKAGGAALGFQVQYPQIELHGVCQSCT